MRRTPLIAVSTALALSGAVVAGPASAATGVGTTTVSASLLRVQLGTDGSLLDVRLLGDDGRATIDPTVSSPQAYSRLTALSLSSSALPAPLNNVSVPNPPLESKTPGGSGNVTTAVVDLANPATGVSIPPSVLTGSISPATLTSAVDAGSSRATLGSELTNLAGVGGLVSAQSAATNLGVVSSAAQAEAQRLLATQAVTVLDLGALLDGLGIALGDLPVDAVTSILDQLDVPVAGIAAGDLGAVVDAINDAVDGLQALIDAQPDPTDLTATLTGSVPVPTELGDLLTGLEAPVPVPSTDTIGDVQATIDGLQATLGDVLAQAMTAIDGLKLLEVEGVDVGVVARAKEKLSASVSNISAKIGAVRLGGLAIPGVDLAGTAAALNATVADVNSRIGSALGAVAPSLDDLVSVKLFDRHADNGTGTVNGYNKAIAGLTAVSASVTPPSDLAGIVAGLVSGTGIAEAITAAGGTVPEVSTVMATLETALGSVAGSVQALAGGARIRVGELRSVADFVAADDSPRGVLPRTGSNDTAAMAGFGLLLAALAVGIRRYTLAPSRKQ